MGVRMARKHARAPLSPSLLFLSERYRPLQRSFLLPWCPIRVSQSFPTIASYAKLSTRTRTHAACKARVRSFSLQLIPRARLAATFALATRGVYPRTSPPSSVLPCGTPGLGVAIFSATPPLSGASAPGAHCIIVHTPRARHACVPSPSSSYPERDGRLCTPLPPAVSIRARVLPRVFCHVERSDSASPFSPRRHLRLVPRHQ